MRQVITAGAFTALTLISVGAAAQETNRLGLSTPVAAPSNAFELKVGTGYTQGFGRLAPNRSLSSAAGPGIGLSLDLDYRVNPRWSVGLESQYQQFSNEQNSSARGLAGNVGATYHFRPYQSGDPFLRLGTGYRFVWENNPLGATGVDVLRHGLELGTLKVGYDFRLSEDVAVAPIIGADLSLFGWEKTSNVPGQALSSNELATFVYAGIQGRFDMGGRRTTGATVAAPPPEPVMLTSAEPPAPPPPAPPPPPTTPVSPSVAVTKDILEECKLQLDSVEHAPKFDFDQSELLPADVEVLSKIADCFVSGPMKGRNMALVGRADPRGTTKYNDALGMRRATSVQDYLVKAGMDAGAIERSSRGKRDAVGTDEASWATDRRVDVLTR
jgi:peptidoglycan-associated lipoprotein